MIVLLVILSCRFQSLPSSLLSFVSLLLCPGGQGGGDGIGGRRGQNLERDGLHMPQDLRRPRCLGAEGLLLLRRHAAALHR